MILITIIIIDVAHCNCIRDPWTLLGLPFCGSQRVQIQWTASNHSFLLSLSDDHNADGWWWGWWWLIKSKYRVEKWAGSLHPPRHDDDFFLYLGSHSLVCACEQRGKSILELNHFNLNFKSNSIIIMMPDWRQALSLSPSHLLAWAPLLNHFNEDDDAGFFYTCA